MFCIHFGALFVIPAITSKVPCTILFTEDFYNTSNSPEYQLNINNFQLPITSSIFINKYFNTNSSPMWCKISHIINNQNIKHYIELVINGLLYEYVADEIQKEIGYKLTRIETKKLIF